MAHRRSHLRWIAAASAAGGIAAAVAAIVATAHAEPARLARGLLLVALLAPVCWIDLDRRLIPNRLTAAGALAATALLLATAPAQLPAALAWAAGAGGFLLLPALIRPDGMGMGDVKLAAVLGLLLGSAVVAALLIALLTATLAGGVVLLRSGTSAARTATLPLGPFLALGALAAFLAA
ncbi:prepilin peptidase [Conexibacter sp. JD483]|uniref:prepilin peptidase n=1 Tax=unclassified Conexibacter TaxID=2627773 RepID=UPI00272807A1|nr:MULTISPECIES: prepilin peptidase [unclassified Conexibacter]MDO8185059.1 prepilin peptidase [Conexibacter sp. CPCC 205706]MDO8196769.1 prepilin peptidase [Conexibacter sp. CPCC 205762]MDR9368017.1 prepilin peptidase [Conexibacter sp. JD483]